MTRPAAPLHKEDVKASIRKEHGSVRAFEKTNHLPEGSVKDVLRGRASERTERAISLCTKQPLHLLFPRRWPAKTTEDSSPNGDGTSDAERAHGLIERSN